MNSQTGIQSNSFIKGLLANICLQVLAYFLTQWLGGPFIFIEDKTGQNIALWMVLGALIVLFLGAVLALPKKSFLSPSLVRPRFLFLISIFILNLAFAFYIGSWLSVLAAFPAYALWHAGQNEFSMRSLAGNFRRKNKLFFYGVAGLLAFVFIFFFLNFEALENRLVNWEKQRAEITFDEPSNIKIPLEFKSPGASYQASASILQTSSAGQNQSAQTKNVSFQSENYIQIPKINVKAPLVFAFGTGQKELNQALNQGVVVYPGSAQPGQEGELFITGHSSTYIWNKTSYGQIFSLLDKLEAGDIVSVFYQGQQYDYRLTSKEILSPAKTKVSETRSSSLALMTCWPPGTTLKRLVVRGELIE